MTPIGESKSVLIANTVLAYASGDLIGQPMPIDVSLPKPSGHSCLLQSLTIVDTSKSNKKLKVVILSDALSTPIADNAAFDPAAADVKNIVDIISIDSWTGIYTAANWAIAKQQALEVATNANRKFYVAILAGEAIT